MIRAYVGVFLIAVACYTFFLPRWADWNANSRLDLVVAVVDDHTLAIDRYVSNTGDYALYNGHYYSDKAPGAALLALPVYALARVALPDALVEQLAIRAGRSGTLSATLQADGAGLDASRVRFFVALAATSFAVGVLPAATLVVLLCWMIGQLGGGRREQIAGAVLYALATPAFPYANSLVGHQTAAAFLFAGFATLFAVRQQKLGPRWVVVGGFCLAYAVITEYPAALIAAIIGVYALVALTERARVLVYLLCGAVLPISALVVHDVAAFGTPLPVGYFHSALWTDVHQVGFVSLTYPHLDALLGITFGVYRGLFFLSPFLLLAVLGYPTLWQRGWHAETLVLAAAPATYLLYNASSAMWSGGFGVGPRYVVASLPFLALPAAVGLIRVCRSVPGRALAGAVVIWSIVAIWGETIGGQAFPDYTPNPLFEFSLPRLVANDIARNLGMLFGLSGWSSLLPLAALLGLGFWIICVPRRRSTAPEPASRPRAVQKRTTWAS